MYSQNNIVLLTGAGVSNLVGLPLSKGFSDIISQSSRYGLSQIINPYLKSDNDDIEKVMNMLEEILSPNANNIHKFLLTHENEYLLKKGNNKVITTRYEEIRHQSSEYLFFIKSELYQLLDSFDLEKASMLYRKMLGSLRKEFPDHKISIFTTNYDLSFEKSFIMNNDFYKSINISDVNYGFDLKFGTLVSSFEKNKNESVIDYYKIHGSLDWHYDNKLICVRSGVNALPKNPNEMPILYPGFKGKPTQQPFIKIHETFFNCLLEANIVIIIGFAMRDPYINDLLKYALTSNRYCLIFYYNPISEEKMPPESGISDLRHFVSEILFHYINSKIQIEDEIFREVFENL